MFRWPVNRTKRDDHLCTSKYSRRRNIYQLLVDITGPYVFFMSFSVVERPILVNYYFSENCSYEPFQTKAYIERTSSPQAPSRPKLLESVGRFIAQYFTFGFEYCSLMDAPYFAMGMTMELADVGNGERQESKDARESWNQRSHQAPSCQPRHQERVEPSGGHCQRMSSSNPISGSTRSSKVGTLLATGRVSSFPSSGDSYLRTAPIMNESFFQMPPDRFRGSIPAVSGLDTREVTVPNVAIQDEYAVENIRIMFPNLSRQQSEQGSSCSSDSGSSDGIESTERPANSKKTHQSSTRGFPNEDVMAEGLDMTLPFPVKLHYIVSNPRFKEYIDWCPHGRAWRVLNQQAFEREVIPLFFRSDKITSFMRQVSKDRLTRNPPPHSYPPTHPHHHRTVFLLFCSKILMWEYSC